MLQVFFPIRRYVSNPVEQAMMLEFLLLGVRTGSISKQKLTNETLRSDMFCLF